MSHESKTEYEVVTLDKSHLKKFSDKKVKSANNRLIVVRAPVRFSDAGFASFVRFLDGTLEALGKKDKPRAFLFDLSAYRLPPDGPDASTIKRVASLVSVVIKYGHEALQARIVFSGVVSKDEKVRKVAKEINRKVSSKGDRMMIFDDFNEAAVACAKRMEEFRKAKKTTRIGGSLI